MRLAGQIWIGEEDSADYWAEGENCEIEVEATDVDEVRVCLFFANEDSEVVGLYVSRSQADKLARLLAAASITPAGIGQ